MNVYQLLTTIPRNDIRFLLQKGIINPCTLHYMEIYADFTQQIAMGEKKMQAYCNVGMAHRISEERCRKIIKIMNEKQ
jgi:hypothetical protein